MNLVVLASLNLPGCAALRGIWNDSEGLGALAARQNKRYGAALMSASLNDRNFQDALIQEVNLIVPENELKWGIVQRAEGEFDFSGYRRLAAFAAANKLAMRGHTLVWYYGNPAWLTDVLKDQKNAGRVLETYIQKVLGETRPVIREWDVVNEAIDPRSSRQDGLRDSIWLKAMGADYIADAYRMASAADPGLTLVYNDYGIEYDDGASRAKRRLMLKLLEKLRSKNVPLHKVGLQSHLQVGRPLGGKDFVDFLSSIRAMGLEIIVTEFDLNLTMLKGASPTNIDAAQIYARTYLDLVQEGAAVHELLTWGLSDRYSWMKEETPDFAGALPLNADMTRGPLWTTLKEAWLRVT